VLRFISFLFPDSWRLFVMVICQIRR
jgi:hypothetical protein